MGSIRRLAYWPVRRTMTRMTGMRSATVPVELIRPDRRATMGSKKSRVRVLEPPLMRSIQLPVMAATPVRISASPTTNRPAIIRRTELLNPATASLGVMMPDSASTSMTANATRSMRKRSQIKTPTVTTSSTNTNIISPFMTLPLFFIRTFMNGAILSFF